MAQTDARLALIREWLSRDLRLPHERLAPASSDASFRRYFRVFSPRGTYIVMDAPPGREDVRPYLKVSALLAALGAHVPQVHEIDAPRGLLLLEDLGTVSYLQRLEGGGDPDALYADALRVLADIQARGAERARELDPYDREALARELALMPAWFLRKHLGIEPSDADRKILDETFEFLISAGLAQPTVFVHRDYHSRNLMVVGERNPGIIDFQDALRGPVGYDLVSLLKDCYISWPRARVENWVSGYRAELMARGYPAAPERQFLRDFDLIGVQRHIKVLGIFARLWHRDGKQAYLLDLPRVLDYVRDTASRYAELAKLGEFLERRIVDELPRANARVAAIAARA
ncbi:MAG TPA: phosphotransferase [Steroidobacteraceae bacterium]